VVTAGTKSPAGARFVLPKLRDPRVTLSVFLTLYTLLGQTVLYFNRDPLQLGLCIVSSCAAEMVLAWIFTRAILFPISAYITGLSIGLLLESYDPRVFVLASLWGIASKYFVRDRQGHFFNPSNFSVVAALALCHGLATVAPGSQWGGKAWIPMVILVLGTTMMFRVRRIDLVGAWLAGYVFMGLLRVAAGQGGVVFALGPMLSGEFALFSFSMLPDPKTSPNTSTGRILWGAGIAVTDGVLRYLEVRYSMFFALFAFCALLPVFRRVFGGSRLESEPWKTVERPIGA
jgi:Na+-translocating ferredoxin:NAD+ oxidoreductase RnfD subunit